MKALYPIMLLLLTPISTCCQFSPPPAISSFGGYVEIDTLPFVAFCKGAKVIEIRGGDFLSAGGPETHDTTAATIGGVPLDIISIVTGGTQDRLYASVPDTFRADTAVTLRIEKRTVLNGSTTTYTYADDTVVYLTGDWFRVTYPDTVFCVGEANPVPSMQLGPGTSAAFCCLSGAVGFTVLPNGEIPLHSGVVGYNRFSYVGDDSLCPDTAHFTVRIMPTLPTRATYGGQVNVSLCQSDPPLVADVQLPEGGRYIAPPGLALDGDSSGTIIPSLSLPGTYGLRYTYPLPCQDTATVWVSVTPSPVASLSLLPNGHACEGEAVAFEAVAVGAAGFMWTHNGAPAGGDSPSYEPQALADGDSVCVVVTNGFGCTDTAAMRAEVRPRPSITVFHAPHALEAGELPYYLFGCDLPGWTVRWSLSVTPQGGNAEEVMQGSRGPFGAGVGAKVETAPYLPGEEFPALSVVCLAASAEAGGCAGEEVTMCAEVLPPGGIFVPEVMTPNGDGMNDVWEVRWPDGVNPAEHRLTLFDRSGGKVLELSPLHSHWDGGTLPDGVYWWVLQNGAGGYEANGGLTIRRK